MLSSEPHQTAPPHMAQVSSHWMPFLFLTRVWVRPYETLPSWICWICVARSWLYKREITLVLQTLEPVVGVNEVSHLVKLPHKLSSIIADSGELEEVIKWDVPPLSMINRQVFKLYLYFSRPMGHGHEAFGLALYECKFVRRKYFCFKVLEMRRSGSWAIILYCFPPFCFAFDFGQDFFKTSFFNLPF